MKIVRTSQLSSAQLGLWFKQQMAPTSPAFIVNISCRLDGQLDPSRLQAAIQAVADASDALRTCFGVENNLPVQYVRENVSAPARIEGLPRDEQERSAREQALGIWAARPFDIARDVLFETALLQQKHASWIWRTRFSHLVVDGVGAYAYVNAVAQAYHQLGTERELDLSFLGSYADHLASDAEYRNSARWQRDRAYWVARHPTAAEPVFRPGRGRDIGLKRRSADIGHASFERFLNACRDEGLPPASALTAVVALVALRQHGRRDLCLGMASHGRGSHHRETLGMFSGYLPFRIDLDNQEKVVAAAKRIDAQLRRDLRARMFTVDQFAGHGARVEEAPVFDLVFCHLRCELSPAMEPVALSCHGEAGWDADRVFLVLHELGDAQPVKVTLTYPPHLADEDEVEAFFMQFVRLVEQWSEIRQLCAGDVLLLDAPGRARAVSAGGGPQHLVPASGDVLSRFDSHAQGRPNAIALVSAAGKTSYGQLQERSLRLAGHLRSVGVGPDSVVGVRLERGEELVAALLAVLRAQGAYLPLDTAIPAERLGYMLDNSGAALLLTTTALAEGVQTGQVVYLDDLVLDAKAADNLAPPEADNLAYVIYTSGSTGKPKGVQISRGALANVMASFEHDLQAGPREVFLSATGISFDIFGLELFLPLCTGATLVLADRERLLETDYLPALAREHRATMLQATPSLIRNLLDTGWKPGAGLRMLIGGEALTANVAQRLSSAAAVFNVYGPTEATIWASIYRVRLENDGAPPIGRPIWNTQLHVLDGVLEPVPQGVTGELYIGGMQLARGYAARPDLTAERFVPSPFIPGERLYRTGDLARWCASGELEYLGRVDQQVKIRGHRIEPGEIETVLADHEAVGAATVVPREDLPGGTQLVAYYTLDAAYEEMLERELATTQTIAWRDIYDSRYAKDEQHGEADAAVWTNSYTGNPYSTDDLREWADATLERIRSLKGLRVLEIGCGSGLLMFPLAPQTRRYVGTDISGEALQLLRKQTEALPQIELRHLPAHGIAALAPETFDLVILNSVVQYFPSASYLLDVLDGAYSLLAPGGHIFVGDVRNLALLPAFRASLAMREVADAPICADIARIVETQCRDEGELCLAPEFFAALGLRFATHSVQVLSRRGHGATEMNAFRFDALLRKPSDDLDPVPAIEKEVCWRSGEWALAHLEALLDCTPNVSFMLRGLPDARVRLAVRMLKSAQDGPAEAPVAVDDGILWIHPEAVIAAAQLLKWAATVRATRADGTFDVLMTPASSWESTGGLLAEAVLDGPPQQFANRPLAAQMHRHTEERLRLHAKSQLPDYMVPAFFVPLSHLPLNTSGKLDRRALPKPEIMTLAEASAACDVTEARVAALMAQVLGLPHAPGRDASFFALGGHSLAAVRLVAQLRETFGIDIGLKSVFENPTVEGLATCLGASGGSIARALVAHKYPAGTHLALSAAQESLWFLDRLQGTSAVYNMPYAFRIDGELDVPALEQAFTALIERHVVLRTVYAEEAGAAVGIVQAAQPFALEMIEAGPPLPQIVRRAAGTPFDLSRDIMLSAHLAHMGAGSHVLVIVVHHIAADALSMHVMMRELAELYAAARDGRPVTLEPLRAQFADYAHWQRHWLESQELGAELEWWRAHLQDAPAVLNLPVDRPRPSVARNRGAQLEFRLDAEQRAVVEALAGAHCITPFCVLLAAYVTLLSRLSGQAEVVVGIPAACRSHSQLDGVIGYFVNTLPVRMLTGVAATGRQLLRGASEAVQGALAHADIPFDRLVQHLGVERSLNHMPVFQAAFAFLAQDLALDLQGLFAQTMPVDSGTARFDLTLQLTASLDGGYAATFEFDTDLFDTSTIERWAGHYGCVLNELTNHPDRSTADMAMLNARQEQTLLSDWNARRSAVAAYVDIVGQFELRARQYPGAVAVKTGEAQITYGELDIRSTKLARHLRVLGARSDTVVGVHLERGIDLMVAILATLKAGAAFLPLDTALPRDRVAYMLGNSNARFVITEGALTPAIAVASPEAFAIDIHVALHNVGASPFAEMPYRDPESLAYLIYTSGSTGRPKGVEISHRALAAFLEAFGPDFEIRSSDVVVCTASISFDMFIAETLPFLCAGGKVLMADRRRLLDLDYFKALIGQEHVTAMIGTPSFVRSLLDSDWAPPPSLRALLGGEALSQQLAERLCSTTSVWNAYGPTEATMAQSAARLQLPVSALPPIGSPFPGSSMYVLDARLNPMPIGVPGELYIGGEQLARGYAGRPDLTAERFVPHPFVAAERLYRTGDVVRWRPDGQLEHFGRADHQVKIRGYRIELSEIESALANHESVEAVAVIAREDRPGDKQLVAYVVARDGRSVEARELQDHIALGLPPYMVPGAFVPLDKLPVTRNGKLDQRALPAPQWSASTGDVAVELDAVEQQVAQLMAQVLGVDAVTDPAQSFFAIGGHSLSAVRLAARLRETFGVDVRLRALFEAPTVSGLAAYVRAHDNAAAQSPFVCLGEHSTAEPLFIVHGADGNAVNFRKLGALLEPHAKVYGIDSVHLWRGGEANEGIGVEQLARIYADRIVSDFPGLARIRLGGWSFGGLVALEMKRHLESNGQQVAVAFAIDSALHAGKTDLPASIETDAGLEQVIGRYLRELGHAPDEVDVLLSDRNPGAFFARLSTAFRSNVEAASRYRPHACEGEFALFLAEQGTGRDAESIEGWRDALGEHLHEQRVCGTHWSILGDADVHALARGITGLLLQPQEVVS
jgi:pristinamycin I synthase 3 and 4